MKTLKDKIVEVRQIALHAECAAIMLNNKESAALELIGEKLDKIILYLTNKEKQSD